MELQHIQQEQTNSSRSDLNLCHEGQGVGNLETHCVEKGQGEEGMFDSLVPIQAAEEVEAAVTTLRQEIRSHFKVMTFGLYGVMALPFLLICLLEAAEKWFGAGWLESLSPWVELACFLSVTAWVLHLALKPRRRRRKMADV